MLKRLLSISIVIAAALAAVLPAYADGPLMFGGKRASGFNESTWAKRPTALPLGLTWVFTDTDCSGTASATARLCRSKGDGTFDELGGGSVGSFKLEDATNVTTTDAQIGDPLCFAAVSPASFGPCALAIAAHDHSDSDHGGQLTATAIAAAAKQGNGTKVQMAGTNDGVAGHALCNDAGGNSTTTGCTSGETAVTRSAPVGYRYVSTGCTIATANNIRYYGFQLSRTTTVSGMTVYMQTGDATNHHDWGIYDSGGNLKFHVGTYSNAATGVVNLGISGGGTVTLDPGLYYFAFTGDANSGVLAPRTVDTALTAFGSGTQAAGGGSALPSTLTSPSTTPATTSCGIWFLLY